MENLQMLSYVCLHFIIKDHILNNTAILNGHFGR